MMQLFRIDSVSVALSRSVYDEEDRQ